MKNDIQRKINQIQPRQIREVASRAEGKNKVIPS